jgi:RNA polymerase sigma-70 factor (ECF subfamily)
MPDPDAALLLAFQHGDEAAFRTLFERYAAAMVGFCQHFVKDRSRAEELAQDVFLKLVRVAPTYEPRARFKTFLYRIASNHCLNELRRGGSARPPAGAQADQVQLQLDDLPGSAPTPEQEAEGGALSRAVGRFLSGLPEKQRVAFVLCRFQGLSYEEVAGALDTTVPAVKSLLHRATVAAARELAPFTPAGGGEP